MGTLGAFIALFYAYLKGRSAMSQSDQEERDRQMAALQSRIRAQEAKNAFIKSKGDENNAKVDNAGTIDDLLGMWDSQQPREGKSNPSNPDA